MSSAPPTFQEFCGKFGFKEYPFNSYTSESEIEKGKDLFVDTSLYSPIFQAFESKQTILLTGDRGTGKTAILYDFLRRLDKKSGLFINIDDFSALPENFDSINFYEFLTKKFSESLFSRMADDKKAGSGLTKDDRILLSYYLARFTTPATKNTLSRKISDLQVGILTKVGTKIYNAFKIPLNIGANLTVHFLGNLASRSMGLTEPPASWNEYFPELNINVDSDFSNAESSFETLLRLTTLTERLGYSRIVFVFDKVDEDARLGNAAEKIALFIKPIVTDNKFLLSKNFQVVISLWVIPYNLLKNETRTQKIYSPTIQWNSSDLIKAFDRRITVFSGRNSEHFSNLTESLAVSADRENFLALSNKNPRDLWHLCDRVFRAQYNIDPASSKISLDAFKIGMDDFVKSFNFYEYYPRTEHARSNSMDIYAYAKHLLKLKDKEFTKNQLNEAARIGASLNNYVSGMESMGLIEKSGQTSGNTTYTIRDPKIVYALEKGLELSKNT